MSRRAERKQTRKNKHGTFTRKVLDKGEPKVVSPEDQRFCKFRWNTSAVSSKNQARLNSGARGNIRRKPRKRGGDGLLRHPNDWILTRVDRCWYCSHCSMTLDSVSRKIGNNPNRILHFRATDSNCVLTAIWCIKQMKPYVPNDISIVILRYAFSDNCPLRKHQYVSECGCRFHISCLDTAPNYCKRHGVKII